MKPMSSAPKDQEIEVLFNGEWYRVGYHDCTWMNDPPMPDAWAVEDSASPGHIELSEAEGWADLNTHTEEPPK
mgnify:CR=1 FL=1